MPSFLFNYVARKRDQHLTSSCWQIFLCNDTGHLLITLKYSKLLLILFLKGNYSHSVQSSALMLILFIIMKPIHHCHHHFQNHHDTLLTISHISPRHHLFIINVKIIPSFFIKITTITKILLSCFSTIIIVYSASADDDVNDQKYIYFWSCHSSAYFHRHCLYCHDLIFKSET